MKKRLVSKLWMISAVLLLMCGIDFAQNSGVEGKVISRIAVQGNRVVSDDKVFSQIQSRTGQQFSEKLASKDTERIAKLDAVKYSYYNTAVANDEVILTFVVVERDIVRDVRFTGNKAFKDKKLQAKAAISRGNFLDELEAESARLALQEFYRSNGYAFAEVSYNKQDFENGILHYQIREGSPVKIAEVKFEGNQALKTRSLKRAVKTKERKFLFWRRYYKPEFIEQDIIKIQKAYQKRGYLDAKIDVIKHFGSNNRRAYIIFRIDEGPVYRIADIELQNVVHLTAERLRDEINFEKNDVYNKTRVDSAVNKIADVYRKAGYVDAQVELEREFLGNNEVKLIYSISPGKRFRIGEIEISGNQEVQDRVIRRVLDEYDFTPGKWYDAEIARGNGQGYLEKLVRRTAVLKDARIISKDTTSGMKNAEVSVQEGRTGSVMLGAGIASDSGLIGQLVYEQRNFDIKDKPKSWKEFITGKAYKGGGQTLRVSLQPGTEVSQYSVSFTEPYLHDKPTSLNLVGSSWEREQESYDEGRVKGYMGLEKRFKNGWRRSLSFRLEDVDIDSLESDAPKEIVDVKGSNLLAGVKLGFGRDKRDDKYDPTKGYSFNVSYEQLGGDHTFGILQAVHRYYKTIREDLAERKTVLATKVLAGTTLGDAPPFEMFYGGGSGTYGIRGFEYRGVSPRGGTGDDPIGSDWIFIANSEITVPMFSKNFSGLVFVDSGMVESGGYRASIGVGVEIKIPRWFGPVPMRFELAAPFMKDSKDDTQAFSFSVGRLF
jgi:outer membrane protein insertion porin family